MLRNVVKKWKSGNTPLMSEVHSLLLLNNFFRQLYRYQDGRKEAARRRKMRTYVPHVLGALHFIWWIKTKYKFWQSGFTKMAISRTSIQEVLKGGFKSANRDVRKEEIDENLRQSRRWFHCPQNRGLAALPEYDWGFMVL